MLCSILIRIINKNLYYGLVRATKLTCEGVESNQEPWNYAIKKTVQTSHHQDHVRYEHSAWVFYQCIPAYLANFFLAIKNVNMWKPFDLGYILKQGDRVFKDVDLNQALAVDEFPLNISIESINISTKILVQESNLFAERNDLLANYRNYTESERDNGAIFTCACLSLP